MLTRPAALLFDMDGTLTRPMIDFDAIRAEIGIRGPILEAIRGFDAERMARAHAVIDRHERDAAERSELNDGCVALLADVLRRGLPTALITRNSAASTRIVLDRHGLAFGHVFHRENGPAKPDPESVWQACRALGVEASNCWMIGDGRHDIEAAVAAGAVGIWLAHGDRSPDFAAPPDAVIASLVELQALLAATLDSRPAGARV